MRQSGRFETEVAAVYPALGAMKISERLLFSCLLFALAPGCGHVEKRASPISAARALPDGATLTIEGLVTVTPGTFASVTGDRSFAVQDAQAGIAVSASETPVLELGQRARVTGTMGQRSRERVLIAAKGSVVRLDGAGVVTPLQVSTGQVTSNVVGRLLRVQGRIVRPVLDDDPYGKKVFIDDGSGEAQIFVHLREGTPLIDTAALSIGQHITVIGVGSQYETVFEVSPRGREDLTR